jgi:hypothetical protein
MALGEQLRRARLERKASASEVSAATHIKVQIIEAMEREDFSSVAAPIYAKGFIRLYAEHLGLDPRPMLEEYSRRLAGAHPSAPGSLIVSQAERTAAHEESRSEPPPAAEERRPAPTPPAEPRPAAEAPRTFRAAPASRAAEPAPRRFTTRPLGGDEPEPEAESAPRRRRLPSVSGALQSIGAAAAARAGSVWSRMSGAARAGLEDMRRPPNEPAFQMPRWRLPAWSLKSLPAALGLLIVLIFVGSCLSRCVRGRHANGAAATPSAGEELNVAFEPPDPYLE